MKRAVCLYRVSTKGQVDKDDIPMQRIECKRFADAMGWVIVKEYTEKGVSGYKVSAANRDAIQEIRQDAEHDLFDVLVVFMFDRLGRRDDETPFLVEWFVKQGIEVWSTQEGQQKFTDHVDKLLNYIRFWQASGESLKTSMRIKTKHQQMVQEGVWRGGARPFGYKLIHTGRIGKKNRQLFDLAVDEAESAIVRDIFDGFCNRGMGIHRLANYLNREYPSPAKIWAPQTVRTILKNPLYVGRMRFNDTLSPVKDELRIISDSDFEFTQRVMADRVTRKTQTRGEIHEDNPDVEKRTKTSIYGASLLSGLLYCGHCGHKLVGTYHVKKTNHGKVYRPVYRCYNGTTEAKGCDGQRTYSALKIETAVLEVVRQYFAQFTSQSMDDVWREQARLQLKQGSKTRLKQAEASLAKLNAQYAKLKEEMVKSMMGESVFDAETIKEMMDQKRGAIAEGEAHLVEVQKSMDDTERELKQWAEQYQQISNWAEVFDGATNDEKKMILARMVQSIIVDKEYNVDIKFFILLSSAFMNHSEVVMQHS